MAWPPRFLFTSGRLSIDFALTGGEGERSYWERWQQPSDLADWMREHPELRVEVTVSSRDLADARELREAIWWGAQAALGHEPIPAWVEDALNRFAATPSLASVLRGGRATWASNASGAQVLATVGRDAIALFGTELCERLRECQNPQCSLLFVDLSRPGRRRWCTMRRCGNLNKLARHRTGHGLADDHDAPKARAGKEDHR